MNRFKEQKQRLSITLLFSVIVILIFVSVLLLVGVAMYVLVQMGVLTGPERADLPALKLLIIFVLASMVVGSGMTLLLSRFPLKSVNQLLNNMNRLAAGDFSARIHIPSPWNRHPGIMEVTDSFNAMAEELQCTEMLRSDFINNFSHEFKTPIVSIAGFAKLLKREQLTDKQREYVRIIEEESLRLAHMATNVLDLTKVENQTILTDVSRYNLSEQLRSCILLLLAKAEEKNIDFQLDFQEQYITGNKELLKHVWINLLDNAIKFSPAGGTVEVHISDHSKHTRVSIMNTGPEIAPECREKIFNKFYQADESHATQGNGVGLAVAKKVAELHHGQIVVHCENGFTTFTVQLPYFNENS